eukprot:403351219
MSDTNQPKESIEQRDQNPLTSSTLSQSLVSNVNNINQSVFGAVNNVFPVDNQFRMMFDQKYYQGRDLFTEYTRQAFKGVQCTKTQVVSSVRPLYLQARDQTQEVKDTLTKNYIRSDNLQQRKNIVNYGTAIILAGTFLALKKGYIRYSFRNAFIFYVGSSYFICTENINPF